jgi:Orsellinic acid/F9775 biosynthesis cluster protein D
MLIVEDDDLKKVECIFNQKMRLIICRRCDLAIAAEHIVVHVKRKHGIQCSEELAHNIVSKYQPRSLDAIVEFKNIIEELDIPVDGIPIARGYRCLICRYCVRQWNSMMDHFTKKHKGQDREEQIEEGVEMQLLFGGQHRKWFPIREPGSRPIDEQNQAAWPAIQTLLAEDRRKGKKRVKDKEENVRVINGFIIKTRWDILIEGEDQKQLIKMAVVAKEKDRFGEITRLCQSYFEEIADKLRVGDVLLRRKIVSEGLPHS